MLHIEKGYGKVILYSSVGGTQFKFAWFNSHGNV